MIRPAIVWGFARAEMRLCRRLVRFWLFQVLAAGIGLLVYAYYMALHYNISAWSATAAIINPRYLLSYLGIYYLYFGFLFGLVFLGFDLRARDSRERMGEVVDALPCTNLELLLGRYLGILIASWLPLVVVAVLFLVLGLPFQESMEPYSILTFLIFMALPACFFMLGLTFLTTLIVRHRLLAAVLLVGFLVALTVVNFRFVPVYLLSLTDLSGAFSVPGASDIIPTVINSFGLVQRAGVLIAGLALLLFAAAIHPRRDDSSRGLQAGIGLVLLAAAAALCGGQVLQVRAQLDRMEAWKQAHQERSDDPAPDLLAMSGNLRIDPGRELDMNLGLRFRGPAGEPLETALFSLNPGLRVNEVRGPGGEALSFEHSDGLLDIELDPPLPGGAETTVVMTIDGRPDETFAYLDSVIEPLTLTIQDSNIFLLGYMPLLFDGRYVALLPGVRYLPATGAEIGRGDPRVRPTDFFQLDLTVELPDGWLAAGPGRRQAVPGESNGARYRFAPPAPVPPVALVAGRFASASTEIGGVTVEALLHPSHAGNLDFFADAAGEIEDWMSEHLDEAADIGLAYPYDALTLVEIPSALRGYGGGWRMDSTLVQPAMILTREAGFPTARFDTKFRNPEQYEDRDGGMPRAKRDMLIRFFENDFSGGNPFIAAARSFFGFQTTAAGPAGLPLDFVCETLAMRLVTERYGYFSVHHMGADLNQTMGRVMSAVFDPSRGEDDLARAIIQAVTSRTMVWDALLDHSLVDLDPWEEPGRTLDVLTLKGGALAESLLDGMGREKTAGLLAGLRRRHAGERFDRSDMVAVGHEVGEDLEGLLSVWIDQTDLPGFTLGEVEAYRLPDRGGTPRYQLLVTLRNEEATPGLLRLEYRFGSSRDSDRDYSKPVRVPGRGAVEIGLVTSRFPNNVRILPYLALNRDPFNVPLPSLDEDKIINREEFSGSRPIAWTPGTGEAVVVDDLDDGFSVESSGRRTLWRLVGRGEDTDLDQGLPVAVFGNRPTRWSRMNFPNAYGKYRHTMALVRAGHGNQFATFTAEIPAAGAWELEFFLPQPRSERARRGRGTWDLTVVDESGERTLSFDATGGEPGWNMIGELNLAGGEVQVRVSDATDGRVVLADAIRWVPVSRDLHGGASR